jgi:hypothetical protein
MDADIMRRAALRRMGERHATMIVFGPYIVPLVVWTVVLGLLAGGSAWVWFNIDHRTIAFVAAAVGIAFVMAYAASTVAATSPRNRGLARATGQRARPLWWHGVGLAGVLLLALAYVSMPL